MLELYYNLFDKFCDIDKFKYLEMDKDSLYLALAEQELTDCVQSEMKAEWENMRSTDCDHGFSGDTSGNFFQRTCCAKRKKHDKREPGFFKEEFMCSKRLCLSSKTYCCYNVTSYKLKFISKGLSMRVLEQSGDGLLEKIARFPMTQ